MILWMGVGIMMVLYGGIFIAGIHRCIMFPEQARAMDITMSKALVIMVLVFVTWLIVGGMAIFLQNLHLAASVLQ